MNNLSAYVRPGHGRGWVVEEIRKIRTGEAPHDGLHLTSALSPFGQRNLLGLWVSMEGAIYDLDETKHWVDQVEPHWGAPIDYLGGVDFGFQNPRLVVFGHYQYAKDGQLVDAYAAHHYWAGKSATPDDLVAAMVAADERYGVSRFYLPHDQPGITKVAKRTLGTSKIRKAKTAVAAGINVVTRLLATDRLVLLRKKGSELAWSELSGYQWKPDKDGGFRDEPLKQKDHYPDAIRYLIATRHLKDELRAAKGEPEAVTGLPVVFTVDDLVGLEDL